MSSKGCYGYSRCPLVDIQDIKSLPALNKSARCQCGIDRTEENFLLLKTSFRAVEGGGRGAVCFQVMVSSLSKNCSHNIIENAGGKG